MREAEVSIPLLRGTLLPSIFVVSHEVLMDVL